MVCPEYLVKEIIQLEIIETDGTNKFELITYLEGGQMSRKLFDKSKIGDEFLYNKLPMGIFTLLKQ